MTRIHANDGSLIAEYARERRIFVPINTVPKSVIGAFLSAEDKNFYTHNGLDFRGIAIALYTHLVLRQTACRCVDDYAAGGEELPADE